MMPETRGGLYEIPYCAVSSLLSISCGELL